MPAIFYMYLFLTRGSSVFAYSENWGASSFSLDIFYNVNDLRSKRLYKPRRDTNMAAAVFAGTFL